MKFKFRTTNGKIVAHREWTKTYIVWPRRLDDNTMGMLMRVERRVQPVYGNGKVKKKWFYREIMCPQARARMERERAAEQEREWARQQAEDEARWAAEDRGEVYIPPHGGFDPEPNNWLVQAEEPAPDWAEIAIGDGAEGVPEQPRQGQMYIEMA